MTSPSRSSRSATGPQLVNYGCRCVQLWATRSPRQPASDQNHAFEQRCHLYQRIEARQRCRIGPILTVLMCHPPRGADAPAIRRDLHLDRGYSTHRAVSTVIRAMPTPGSRRCMRLHQMNVQRGRRRRKDRTEVRDMPPRDQQCRLGRRAPTGGLLPYPWAGGAINGRALPHTQGYHEERKSLATSPNRALWDGSPGRMGVGARCAPRTGPNPARRLRQAGGALGADRCRMPIIPSWSLRPCCLRWSAKARSYKGILLIESVRVDLTLEKKTVALRSTR